MKSEGIPASDPLAKAAELAQTFVLTVEPFKFIGNCYRESFVGGKDASSSEGRFAENSAAVV
jgi:hypothetical protein